MPDYSIDSNKNIKSLSTWKNEQFGTGTYLNNGSLNIPTDTSVSFGGNGGSYSFNLNKETSDYVGSLNITTLHGCAVLFGQGWIRPEIINNSGDTLTIGIINYGGDNASCYHQYTISSGLKVGGSDSSYPEATSSFNIVIWF